MADTMDIDKTVQPYTFDLGHLACYDSNPLPSLDTNNKEEILSRTAQATAQALLHQLLNTCPITRSDADGALQIILPDTDFRLPREKPVPKEKEKTVWQKFAEKKGIKTKRKDGKVAFDEETGEWKQKYGYKPGQNKKDGDVQGNWLVEIDEKAERAAKEDRRGGKPGKEKGQGDVARRDKKIINKSARYTGPAARKGK